MSTYQQLETQLSQDLIDGYSDSLVGKRDLEAEAALAASGMSQVLQNLVDSLPYYGSPDWNSAFRGALANLAASNLPNSAIAAHPMDYGFGYVESYSYDGPYSGYRDAFFHGIATSTAASEVLSQVQTVNAGLSGPWWGSYGLALLTDAVRSKVSVAVDSSKLTSAMAGCHGALLPALSAAYLAVIKSGYSSTATAYQAIVQQGLTSQCATELTAAVKTSAFIANSNEAIAMGGDSTNAATWFLYNNWILLKLLGSDVDSAITVAKAAGLTVPAEVGPSVWWNGGANGYTEWFAALSGADVSGLTGSIITASMPESTLSSFSGSPIPVSGHTTEANGYSVSLTSWGDLASYKQKSSCLGEGTGVLMADGSVKLIEEVVPGDSVWTPDGPWKVALVESPPRDARELTRIDDLNLWLTPGHPLRMAKADGPRYASAGAWTLRDTTPTMTESGVVELVPGAELLAVSNQQQLSYKVKNVRQQTAQKPCTQKVYDLLLEDWEKSRPSYYVGGPAVFVAVEAESSNPLREPPSTLALLAALDGTVTISREHVQNPADTLSTSVDLLIPETSIQEALREGWRHEDGTALEKPVIPGPDYYMVEGHWDPHASMLEAYLLRRFARNWRRILATGWRNRHKGGHPGDHLTLLVHDLELVGEAAESSAAKISISATLLDHGLDFTATKALETVPKSDRRWHPRFDMVLDFGPRRLSAQAALLISVLIDGQRLAAAHIPLDASALDGHDAQEFFLAAPHGTVFARVAFDMRWCKPSQIRAEEVQKNYWSPQKTKAAALAMGQRIGQDLSEILKSGG